MQLDKKRLERQGCVYAFQLLELNKGSEKNSIWPRQSIFGVIEITNKILTAVKII